MMPAVKSQPLAVQRQKKLDIQKPKGNGTALGIKRGFVIPSHATTFKYIFKMQLTNTAQFWYHTNIKPISKEAMNTFSASSIAQGSVH